MEFESIGGHSSSEPLMLATLTATTTTDTTAGEHPEVLIEDMKNHLSQGKEDTAATVAAMPPVMHSTQKCMHKEAALPWAEHKTLQA